MFESYYEALEIEPTKDIKEIKKAYARVIKKYHPEDNPEEYRNVRHAYEYLTMMYKDRPIGFDSKSVFSKGEIDEDDIDDDIDEDEFEVLELDFEDLEDEDFDEEHKFLNEFYEDLDDDESNEEDSINQDIKNLVNTSIDEINNYKDTETYEEAYAKYKEVFKLVNEIRSANFNGVNAIDYRTIEKLRNSELYYDALESRHFTNRLASALKLAPIDVESAENITDDIQVTSVPDRAIFSKLLSVLARNRLNDADSQWIRKSPKDAAAVFLKRGPNYPAKKSVNKEKILGIIAGTSGLLFFSILGAAFSIEHFDVWMVVALIVLFIVVVFSASIIVMDKAME